VVIEERSGRAGRSGARSRPLGRSLSRPDYRNSLAFVAGVRFASLSDVADSGTYLHYGNSSATSRQNATAVWDFGGSNHSGVVWYPSRG
jgi:hypothetical protein